MPIVKTEDDLEEKQEADESIQGPSPLPLGAEAETFTTMPHKVPTDTDTGTSGSFQTSGTAEKQKPSISHTSSYKTSTQTKMRRGISARSESRLRDRTKFTRRPRSDKKPKDPIEVPNDFPVDNLLSGFEDVAVDWCKVSVK